ncbi:MAG TPA: endonuclease/exonuclease/phosphatase family protein [Candidatus Lokiarchaeia archaeon]|nr:endonuclease/exonuclease/phosphatase family protein [Candidatus Lokiarchaeia archaeon]
MLELLGSVNPRITDDLFGLLYPAGFLSLALNAGLTGACLLVYSLTFWLVRDHFSMDTRSRRDLAVELVVIAVLGNFLSLLAITFTVHLIIRCFAYGRLAVLSSKTRSGSENSVRGNLKVIRIKLAFLKVFLVVIVLGFVAIPVGLYFLFSGFLLTYYYTLYGTGAAIAIVFNAIKKPQGMPSFLAPWRPSRRLKLAIMAAVIVVPVLCSAVILPSGVIKYHAPAPSAPTSSIMTSICIVTYNIRNGITQEVNPANDWVNRRDAFGAYLASLDADIIGVQEAYQFQLEDIKGRLNTILGTVGRNYEYTGFGRNDGVHGGEHAAIFFDASKFTFLDGDTFWLSSTPDFPSKPWDPSNYRVCTWARLEISATRAQFVVFCTHYATVYNSFAEPASALIKDRMPLYAGGLPTFLIGDFNMVNSTRAFAMLLHNGTITLVDSYKGHATYSTAPDFNANYKPTGNKKIDFILVNGLINVTSCTIPRASYGSNQTYSDHYPVVVNCTF